MPLSRPFLCLALALLAALPARAQDRRIERSSGAKVRQALVVGNDRYPAMPLRNGLNDARAVAAALSELGFSVETKLDVDGVGLERAARAFVGRLAAAEVGFFFYAGHGLQIDGENYLVPVDFDAQDEIEAKHRAYKVDELREQMERSGSRVNVIVLDACRDNPFRFTRSGTRGLGAMQPGRGTLIALATGPGQTASDNAAAANGLFTGHLLAALRQPVSLEQVFRQAKEAVSEASGQKQRPWVLSDLTGEVFLRAPEAAAAVTPPGAPPAAAAGPSEAALEAETALWRSAEGTNSKEAYEAYLERYPEGTFAAMARVRLKALASPPAGATTTRPARPTAAGAGDPNAAPGAALARPRPTPAPTAAPPRVAARPTPAPDEGSLGGLLAGVGGLSGSASSGRPAAGAEIDMLGVTVSATGPARVTAVEPGGSGARAGLRVGDVITTLDGKEAGSAPSLVAFLGARAITATLEGGTAQVRLGVRRQGQDLSLTAVLDTGGGD